MIIATSPQPFRRPVEPERKFHEGMATQNFQQTRYTMLDLALCLVFPSSRKFAFPARFPVLASSPIFYVHACC